MAKKSSSTEKVTRENIAETYHSSNPAKYPVVYAEDVWDTAEEDSNLKVILGEKGTYAQNDINEAIAEKINKINVKYTGGHNITVDSANTISTSATKVEYEGMIISNPVTIGKITIDGEENLIQVPSNGQGGIGSSYSAGQNIEIIETTGNKISALGYEYDAETESFAEGSRCFTKILTTISGPTTDKGKTYKVGRVDTTIMTAGTVLKLNNEKTKIVSVDATNKTITLQDYVGDISAAKIGVYEDSYKPKGEYAHSEGFKTHADGCDAHAEGSMTSAVEFATHAEGYLTEASGSMSHAEGEQTKATGRSSQASGCLTQADGDYSHAEGYNTIASSGYTHTEGYKTISKSVASHAEGSNTKTYGYASHAEGSSTTASGGYSHAEGQGTTASGSYSHAEGYYTAASNNASHTEGNGTTASGEFGSHAEGYYTAASGDFGSHAEGSSTTASGEYSHAEGNATKSDGNGSHAEGEYTKANGEGSHAEGYYTKADGENSHAEGLSTYNISGTENMPFSVTKTGTFTYSTSNSAVKKGKVIRFTQYGLTTHKITDVSTSGSNYIITLDTTSYGEVGQVNIAVLESGLSYGKNSHAEGISTAFGDNSHSEGSHTFASGDDSHAEGTGTIAMGKSQHVQGRWNIPLPETQATFIIGNGTDDEHRSNAMWVSSGGTVNVNNIVTNNSGKQGSTYVFASNGDIININDFGLSWEEE